MTRGVGQSDKRRDRIPVAGPWISEREIEYVTDAVRTGWYERAGEYPQRFEKAFAAHTRRRHAIALPSCTSGLHLALLAAGVGPGDRVAVPDMTWIASAAPVTYVGAEPVFVDVDPTTWCMDVASFERIAERVTAAIPVDLYGNMPDWPALTRIAEHHGVTLVEDAAEAAGARFDDVPAGGFGRAAAFSFHGSKTVTTGEGGMLVCDDDELYERCRFLADHGRLPGDVSFRSTEVAYKYKMSALQAALGLAQLERLDELIDRKRMIFHWYEEELSGVDGLALNQPGPRVEGAYWMVTAIWDAELGVDKFAVLERLRERGVDCRPIFSPLSSIDAYTRAEDRERAATANTHAYSLGARGINLPSPLDLEQDEVRRASASLLEVLGLER
jgi:perosamine synthetase